VQKNLIIKIVLFWTASGTTLSARAEKPPESVMRNIDSLSTIHAALSMCVNGADRKLISANESYARRKLMIEIEELVRNTAAHYKTDVLHSAFIISSMEYSKNEELKKQIKHKYKNSCSYQLFYDSDKILLEAQIQFPKYLNKK
jgi:hypothetical protein